MVLPPPLTSCACFFLSKYCVQAGSPRTFITVVVHQDDFLQQVGRRVVDSTMD